MGRELYNTKSEITAMTQESIKTIFIRKQDVIAGATSELTYISPAPGTIGILMNVTMEANVITGGTTGTHFMEVKDSAQATGIVTMASNHLAGMVYNYNEVQEANAGKFPSDQRAFSNALIGMVFTEEIPLFIHYYNGTDGTCAERRYGVVYKEIKVK